MTKSRFVDEFKEEAAKQVFEWGYTVGEVAKRLGISVKVCTSGWGFILLLNSL